jgi:hypothetical protein
MDRHADASAAGGLCSEAAAQHIGLQNEADKQRWF